MSQFSTGELAKAAEVSVRTVQYYDQRGILTPSEVTEGGRRIYHDSDLERLQVICFLRDLDFSINQIKKLLQEENREQVLELLLTDQIESGDTTRWSTVLIAKVKTKLISSPCGAKA